jgi:hypothetical protein
VQLLGSTQFPETFEGFKLHCWFLLFDTLLLVLFLLVAFFLLDVPLPKGEMILGSTQPSEALKVSSTFKLFDLLLLLVEPLVRPFCTPGPGVLEVPPLSNCPLKSKQRKI